MVSYPERMKSLYNLLKPCRLCPHACGIDRFKQSSGKCRSGLEVRISSNNLHLGEEPPISGFNGSGTIFFTNCSLSCVFCQNYPISQLGNGNPVTTDKLVSMMLELQDKGAHNINFVTPTHYAAHMAQAVVTAKKKGLSIPILYNSGGYDDVQTLRLLEGIVDIYMPDAKYSDDSNAMKYSGTENYSSVNRAALVEMHRQAGGLVLDKNGIAMKGLIIRHLVLPGGISGSKEVLRFIAEKISPATYLSLMAQYHPADAALKYPELSKRLSEKEYAEILDFADGLGFENGWRQEL